MKRKLNEDDVPIVETKQRLPGANTFEDLGLDLRLLKATAKKNFSRPTPIQAQAIPLALDGRHIVARAGTGTGKTAAYILPILHSLVKRSEHALDDSSGPKALILVPTRELASQVTHVTAELSGYCSKQIHVVNISSQQTETSQRTKLASSPNIVVSTPASTVSHLKHTTLSLAHLDYLVIDEADLVLSYHDETQFQHILQQSPRSIQTFLASATITPEVTLLKDLFATNPVILDLQQEEQTPKRLLQYSVVCGEQEKFLILFALLKLKLINGKCIIFTASVDRCYHLRLFLQSFGISSCVLNSELPVNCRIQVVKQFNENVYNIIIAADEHEMFGDESADRTVRSTINEDNQEVDERRESECSERTESEQRKSKMKPNQQVQKRRQKDKKEFGISRGIDFRDVACVLNFDFPISKRSYTHRIGRTARAERAGTAISLVVPKSEYRKYKNISVPSTQKDEIILADVVINQRECGHDIKPYHFDMKKLNAFQYRVASALKTVSPGQIRKARLDELRQELLKSEKLKRHLEENPEDLQYLRHDTIVKAGRVQPHLKHVPEYLLPGRRKAGISDLTDPGRPSFLGLKRPTQNKIRKARERNKTKSKVRKVMPGSKNPLRNLKGKR